MLKSEEIALLKELAERLGPYSYCGPWLHEQIPWVERDIRADLPPSPSWEGSRQLAYEIRCRADSEAQSILESAHKEAKAKAEAMAKDSSQRYSYAIAGLKRALKDLEGY